MSTVKVCDICGGYLHKGFCHYKVKRFDYTYDGYNKGKEEICESCWIAMVHYIKNHKKGVK